MTCHQAEESLCLSVSPADQAGRGCGSPTINYCPFKDIHFTRASEEGWYNNANMLPHRASRDVYVVMLHAGLFNEAN